MPKWAALGDVADKNLADVDPDSVSNIYDEAELGVPKAGPYLAVVKRLQGTESKAGDPMLKMVIEIAEPKGSKKAKFNGYGIWNYIVSTKESASRVNQFLHAILDGKPPAQRQKIIQAYWAGNVVIDEQGFITKIGTWTVPQTIAIGVNTATENSSEYGERLKVTFGGIMPASDRPASKVADVEDDDDEDEDDEDTEDDADEVEAEAEADAEAREEELNGLSLTELRAIAKELGVTGKGKAGLVEAILDAEFADDEEEEEEEEEEPEEEAEEAEGDEFDEMDRAALKKFNTAEKLGIRVTSKMTDDDLRDAIRAALPEDEEEAEEDDEDEPEPAKPARAKAKAGSPTRAAAKRRKGDDSEPPF